MKRPKFRSGDNPQHWELLFADIERAARDPDHPAHAMTPEQRDAYFRSRHPEVRQSMEWLAWYKTQPARQGPMWATRVQNRPRLNVLLSFGVTALGVFFIATSLAVLLHDDPGIGRTIANIALVAAWVFFPISWWVGCWYDHQAAKPGAPTNAEMQQYRYIKHRNQQHDALRRLDEGES